MSKWKIKLIHFHNKQFFSNRGNEMISRYHNKTVRKNTENINGRSHLTYILS